MSKDILFKTLMLKGEQGGTIISIEKIGSQGSTDYMRITLDDGSTVDFEVLNTLDDDHVRGIIAEESPAIVSEAVEESKDYTDSKIVDVTSLVNTIYPVGSILMSTNSANPSTYLNVGTWEAWGSGRVPVGVNTSDSDFNTVNKTGGEKSHELLEAEIPSHNHNFEGSSHTHTIEGISGDTTGQYWGSGRASITVQADGAVMRNTPDGNTQILGTDEGSSGNGYYNNIRLGKGTMNTGATTQGGTIHNTGGSQAHNNLQPYITCYMWRRTA